MKRQPSLARNEEKSIQPITGSSPKAGREAFGLCGNGNTCWSLRHRLSQRISVSKIFCYYTGTFLSERTHRDQGNFLLKSNDVKIISEINFCVSIAYGPKNCQAEQACDKGQTAKKTAHEPSCTVLMGSRSLSSTKSNQAIELF